MKALLIFGARPNYMKIAPLYRAMLQEPACTPVLVNTGQHFDKAMSDAFVEALGLPEPDIHLHVGVGSQAQQIARVMQKLEPVLTSFQPDVTVVVGDVSSTLAATLVSSTVGVPVAHVEAGLRSRDWSMPEERNRVLTDRMSQLLFTPSEDADANLMQEGIDPKRVFMVGNVMIDTLDWVLPRLPRRQTREAHKVPDGEFALVTLHRAGNVDNPEILAEIMRGLEVVGERLPLLFPIHPRTQKRLAEYKIDINPKRIKLLPPLGYMEFVSLLAESSLVLTDSGGIQEETTVLGVPCLTLRENTERPITLKFGLNELVKSNCEAIVAAADRALSQGRGEPQRPPLWDGHAAPRTVDILCKHYAPVRAVAPAAAAPRPLRPFTAVILAGGIRPSPLGSELGIHPLCLPITGNRTLLCSWIDAFDDSGVCRGVRIVVSDETEAEEIGRHLAELERTSASSIDIEVLLEPARWRGTGGILRDVLASAVEGEIVVLAEAGCLPPSHLDALLSSLDDSSMAVVGVGAKSEPAGVYALRRDAFELIPQIGFYDIKEQLLPALHGRGFGARAVKVVERVDRVRTRAAYLQAVARRFDQHNESTGRLRELFAGTISQTARILGTSLIGRNVTIEDGAIVHDSVILSGAVVKAGAIVSRSVVAPRAEVGAQAVVTDAVAASSKRALEVDGSMRTRQASQKSRLMLNPR